MSFELYDRETCMQLFGKRVGYPSLLQVPLQYERGIDVFDEIQGREKNLFSGKLLISLGVRDRGLVIGAFDGRTYYHTGLFDEHVSGVVLTAQGPGAGAEDEECQLLRLSYDREGHAGSVVLRCLRKEREETIRFFRLAFPQRFEVQDGS